MPGPCKTPCLKSTGLRGLPQYSPTREAFPMEAHGVRIVQSLPARCPIPCPVTFPQGTKTSSAPGNRSAPTPALTSCSSFGSGNAAGLAASAPPAGDTVLRGTPLRQRTPRTPQIPPLQSHSWVWQPALGRVTHTTESFADRSLKWARGTY